MITPNKIRAGRALIGWSQTELSERSGLAAATVQSIEAERGTVKTESLELIKRAFEQESVFFTEFGVEIRNTAIYPISGEDWWLHTLDDVYYTLIDQEDAELLMLYADDRESSSVVNDRIRKIRNAGIKMRQLVKEDNRFLMGPVKEYKWVPKEFFHNRVTLIYGNKIVLCAEDNTKALVIKDKGIADTFRNTFEMLWCGVVPIDPDRSTADERF